MAYNKNLKIDPNNVVNISGSLITLSGSLSGTEISGTTAQFTIVSASVVSASQYLGLNITASVISGSELNIDYIDFVGQNPPPDYRSGRMYYDGLGSYFAGTDITNLSIDLAQQTVVRVKNGSGDIIPKGKLVRIIGGSGTNPLITTASWEDDNNSANTLGMTLSSTDDNEFTYVLLNGIIQDIDLNASTFSEGEILYLSSSGDYTNIKPFAPLHAVKIGEVVRAQQNNGVAFINIQNGYEIEELHDVLITNRQNGDVISFDSANSVWKNGKTLSGSYTIMNDLTVSGSITELSTRRIKTNIQTLESQLQTISKLNPVSYTRVDDGRKEFGFISEEVREVYPQFVVGEGINYPKMVSILVSAVKELTEKMEIQREEIELLKNKKRTTRGKK